jgi:small subunit ribosomal protein S9
MTDETTDGVADPDETPRDDEPTAPAEESPRVAAEDAVGAQETPSARELDREQAIVDESPAESEEILAEETSVAGAVPPAGTEPAVTSPSADTPAERPTAGPVPAVEDEEDEDYVEQAPRIKPEIPGMDLEVDIVREGEEALRDEDDEGADADADADADEDLTQPIADAAIDLGAGARYAATGKRKTAVARVLLKPGTGAYTINGRTLDLFFPRLALQRTIRQALETVGLEEKIDVIATMHGGGVSAQADALRHGISKALVDADPHLRSELKRRGFLTRDARVKERKKAGLKKARKRPQFSKR